MTRTFLCRLTLFFFIVYFLTFVSCSYFLPNASDTSAQPKSESSPVIVNDRVFRLVGSTTTPFAKSYNENVSLGEGNRIKNKRTNDLKILDDSSPQRLVE